MLEQMPALCKAMTLAAVIGFIRVLKDDEPRLIRQLIEVPFCGFIAVAVFYGLKAAGLENYEDLSVFLGGAVGMLGSNFIREIACWIARQKVKMKG